MLTLSPFEKVLLATMLISVMVAVGCSLSTAQFRAVLRSPRGVVIGLVSQLGGMPLLAYGLARGLALPVEVAVGLIFVGCTPGGSLSNAFTYFARGNVALSISMTVTSSLAAVVAMPPLVLLYTSQLASAELVVPYGTVLLSMSSVLVPVGIGMLIRQRSLRKARAVERWLSRVGLAAFLTMAVVWSPSMAASMGSAPGAAYAAIVLLAFAGFGFGLLAATVARLPLADRKAVSIETGIQNTALTFAVVSLSFPQAQAAAIGWVPLVYGALTLGWAALVTFAYRRIVSPAPAAATQNL